MSFRNILIIDNFDSFTYNLVDFFRVAGAKVSVARNNISVSKVLDFKPDLLVLSPGPSVPKNAGNLMAIIDEYKEKLPIFGVCLGHEALIEAFGGTLKLTSPVHGKRSKVHNDGKTIFKKLEQDFPAGRYHSLVGDIIPECFEVSARYGDLVMAMRHKTLPIESVQFHPESVLSMENENGMKIIENIMSGSFAKPINN